MMAVLSKLLSPCLWQHVMLLFFVCFLAFWSSFALLQPCGRLEGGVILGVMSATLVPWTLSMSKFVKSPKLAFIFILVMSFSFFLVGQPTEVFFQNIPNMNKGESLMLWVFCLVQVKSFSQYIFRPCPWFTKSKHDCVVSYKLGYIMLDDAPFCFQTQCKSWSTTSKTWFIEVILHPVPKCCKFLLIPDHWVLWFMEKWATQLPLLIYNKKNSFSCFQLWVCKVIGCCRCFNNV